MCAQIKATSSDKTAFNPRHKTN